MICHLKQDLLKDNYTGIQTKSRELWFSALSLYKENLCDIAKDFLCSEIKLIDKIKQ
jgi:hypothetical protein